MKKSTTKQQIEVEFKFRLLKREYEALLVQASRVTEQTNAFFDTSTGILGQHRVALRLRFTDQTAELTMKTPHRSENSSPPKLSSGLSSRNEVTEILKIPMAQAVFKNRKLQFPELSEIRTQLGQWLDSPQLGALQMTGFFVTARAELLLSGGLVAELDRVRLPSGKTYYEIELETQSPDFDKSVLLQLFRKFKIPLRPGTQSKLARLKADLTQTKRTKKKRSD